ncbi:hypothetical protein MRB53_018446 [Persea americana]|uniref:Uncharacterized protein n=1 Tax=Persea americana TaxID=3435 RepID=A0ACC2M7Y0_PERAE|nr:hypothetical protein MRB53_018446 [Persea americana]
MIQYTCPFLRLTAVTAPSSATVHTSHPPSLELWAHPLRETQEGSFLGTITAADWQFWAGVESGRFWNINDALRLSKESHLKGNEAAAWMGAVVPWWFEGSLMECNFVPKVQIYKLCPS